MKVLELYYQGLLTKQEAVKRLEKLQIRGAFGANKYIGYDYNNQKWITYRKTDPQEA